MTRPWPAHPSAPSAPAPRLQQHLLEQVVDALPVRAEPARTRVAAEVFRTTSSATSSERTRSWFARLSICSSPDDRHLGRFAWWNGFLGCGITPSSAATTRMDDVGRLRTRARIAVTRRGRGVEEGDHAARRLDVVRADVLRDAAGSPAATRLRRM